MMFEQEHLNVFPESTVQEIPRRRTRNRVNSLQVFLGCLGTVKTALDRLPGIRCPLFRVTHPASILRAGKNNRRAVVQ